MFAAGRHNYEWYRNETIEWEENNLKPSNSVELEEGGWEGWETEQLWLIEMYYYKMITIHNPLRSMIIDAK